MHLIFSNPLWNDGGLRLCFETFQDSLFPNICSIWHLIWLTDQFSEAGRLVPWSSLHSWNACRAAKLNDSISWLRVLTPRTVLFPELPQAHPSAARPACQFENPKQSNEARDVNRNMPLSGIPEMLKTTSFNRNVINWIILLLLSTRLKHQT